VKCDLLIPTETFNDSLFNLLTIPSIASTQTHRRVYLNVYACIPTIVKSRLENYILYNSIIKKSRPTADYRACVTLSAGWARPGHA